MVEGLPHKQSKMTMVSAAPNTIELKPQPGPQTAFLTTEADICLYGGQAGGGKSFALLLDQLRWTSVKGYAGVIFRRTSPELEGSGSIWEEASGIFPAFGATMRSASPKLARFPNGSLIEFRHLQLEKDKLAHQSKQYAVIGFDEITHFTESQFWYILSRNRSTSGVKPYVRGTCNPSAESWVRQFIDWWIDPETGLAIPERSGVIRWMVRDSEDDRVHWADRKEGLPVIRGKQPLSVTFINSTLEDNPALLEKDPDYADRLQNLPRKDRERLAGGNWNIRDDVDAEWPAEYFQGVRESERPGPDERQFTIITLDPSLGRTDKSDYSCFCILDVDREGVMHVTTDISRRDISQIVADGLELYRIYQPLALAIERNGFAALRELFEVSAGTTTLSLASVWQSANKLARIRIGVGTALQQRRLRFVESPGTTILLGQLQEFPLATHDDGPDALEMAIRVVQSVLAGEHIENNQPARAMA